MAKLWKTLIVLVLGATVEVPAPDAGSGWSVHLPGPALAIIIYGILTLVTLTKTLNQLPGVFALKSPLGVVRSGYEYLWSPAILVALIGFRWNGVIEGREGDDRYWTIVFGATHDSYLPLVALGVFAILMWSLKFRAIMIEANSRLEAA